MSAKAALLHSFNTIFYLENVHPWNSQHQLVPVTDSRYLQAPISEWGLKARSQIGQPRHDMSQLPEILLTQLL
jgi:hypothetical protein